MGKYTNYFGIDVSKNTFDIWSDKTGHKIFENNSRGFKVFKRLIKENDICVLEYTGSYYQNLALFLFQKGIKVSIVNPLKIKRFIQMKFQKNKSDKSDAIMISMYAKEQLLELWEPEPAYIEHSKDILNTVSLYYKQTTALKNKLHSLTSRKVKGFIITSLKRQLRNIQKEIKLLEKSLEEIIQANEPQLLNDITSIKGVGKKTAILMIAETSAFSKFENAKQVASFFGLAPSEYSSGSSIRGKSRITKRGNPLVRNHLFMCSFTACSTNRQCSDIYNRIVAKGKSKKLALIAVCNKLIKQIFAVAKSGMPYDPDYKPVFNPY